MMQEEGGGHGVIKQTFVLQWCWHMFRLQMQNETSGDGHGEAARS